jgi:hypothetical protein
MTDSAPPAAEASRGLPRDALGWLVLAAPWALYLPLGTKYAVYLGLGVASVATLQRGGRLTQALRHPLFLAVLAFWCWLIISVAWTPAATGDVVAHLWTYSLLLWVVPIALACPPGDARRALRHFVVASTLAALLWLVESTGLRTDVGVWLPFVEATGNRRIALSLMLALGAALGTLLALDGHSPRERWLWAACALLCTAGVALQDRRSGMVVLPAMLVVLAWVRQPTWPRRVAVTGAVLVAIALGWTQLDTVQQRFAEGVAELRSYDREGDVATSWGMRLRMYEVTAAMVRERPLAGHGAGSWVSLWRERVSSDGKLGRHTAPHQEYLLVATQGGAVALALLLAAIVAALRAAQRAGPDGHALLLVLVTLVVAGLFNVVLRDAKFALPLLTLAVLAGAASRPPMPRRAS